MYLTQSTEQSKETDVSISDDVKNVEQPLPLDLISSERVSKYHNVCGVLRSIHGFHHNLLISTSGGNSLVLESPMVHWERVKLNGLRSQCFLY